MPEMVTLKYKGRKSPFVFTNPQLQGSSFKWSKSGDAIEVLQSDAEWFAKNHPSDFSIVSSKHDEVHIEVPTQVDEEPDKLVGDGVDGIGGEVAPETPTKRGPGRPKTRVDD